MNVRILVGRLSPIHLGHIETIDTMLKDGVTTNDKTIIFLGSSNTALSYRQIFTYSQRRFFLSKCYSFYPEFASRLNIIPIADMNDDKDWRDGLYSILNLIDGYPEFIFYAGSEYDLRHFELPYNTKIKVINRNKNNISSTLIKKIILKDLINQDAMHKNAPIHYDFELYKNYLDRRVYQDIIKTFRDNFCLLQNIDYNRLLQEYDYD